MLSKIAVPGHPNIVETMFAYIREDGTSMGEGTQCFNFVFPLALGNLKQLFRGSLGMQNLHGQAEDLWGEFEGLASAVRYLHGHCRTAHRDIKPSNILLYDDPVTSRLKAKIADFGLAISLDGVALHTPGTLEYRSAINYAAPEVRKALNASEVGRRTLPSPSELTSGDIWKLGAVFVELLTFLLLGAKGVKRFRDSITVHEANLTSDSLTRFDDGDRVKVEVLEWLISLAKLSMRAAEIESLLRNMLGDAHSRPSASQVVTELRSVSYSP